MRLEVSLLVDVASLPGIPVVGVDVSTLVVSVGPPTVQY